MHSNWRESRCVPAVIRRKIICSFQPVTQFINTSVIKPQYDIYSDIKNKRNERQGKMCSCDLLTMLRLQHNSMSKKVCISYNPAVSVDCFFFVSQRPFILFFTWFFLATFSVHHFLLLSCFGLASLSEFKRTERTGWWACIGWLLFQLLSGLPAAK